VRGAAGAALFTDPRESHRRRPWLRIYGRAAKDQLASGSLRKSLPIDEEVDLDDDVESEPLKCNQPKRKRPNPTRRNPSRRGRPRARTNHDVFAAQSYYFEGDQNPCAQG